MIASPSGCVEPSDEQIVVADDSSSLVPHSSSFILPDTSLPPILPQSCPGSGKKSSVTLRPTAN